MGCNTGCIYFKNVSAKLLIKSKQKAAREVCKV